MSSVMSLRSCGALNLSNQARRGSSRSLSHSLVRIQSALDSSALLQHQTHAQLPIRQFSVKVQSKDSTQQQQQQSASAPPEIESTRQYRSHVASRAIRLHRKNEDQCSKLHTTTLARTELNQSQVLKHRPTRRDHAQLTEYARRFAAAAAEAENQVESQTMSVDATVKFYTPTSTTTKSSTRSKVSAAAVGSGATSTEATVKRAAAAAAAALTIEDHRAHAKKRLKQQQHYCRVHLSQQDTDPKCRLTINPIMSNNNVLSNADADAAADAAPPTAIATATTTTTSENSYQDASRDALKLQEFTRIMSEYNLEPDEPLALAFSGGADSSAALLLLVQWHVTQQRTGKLYIMQVDHCLRPESASEVEYCNAWIRALRYQAGLTHTELVHCKLSIQWPQNVDKRGDDASSSEQQRPALAQLQNAARVARYARLASRCRYHSVRHLLVAHHAEDQFETLMMRLARGTHLTGMIGMQSRSWLDKPSLAATRATAMLQPVPQSETPLELMRPFLGVTKQQLQAVCRLNGIVPVDDKSNRNEAFDRVRARHGLQQAATAVVATSHDDKSSNAPPFDTVFLMQMHAVATRAAHELEQQSTMLLQRYAQLTEPYRSCVLNVDAMLRDPLLHCNDELLSHMMRRIVSAVSNRVLECKSSAMLALVQRIRNSTRVAPESPSSFVHSASVLGQTVICHPSDGSTRGTSLRSHLVVRQNASHQVGYHAKKTNRRVLEVSSHTPQIQYDFDSRWSVELTSVDLRRNIARHRFLMGKMMRRRHAKEAGLYAPDIMPQATDSSLSAWSQMLSVRPLVPSDRRVLMNSDHLRFLPSRERERLLPLEAFYASMPCITDLKNNILSVPLPQVDLLLQSVKNSKCICKYTLKDDVTKQVSWNKELKLELQDNNSVSNLTQQQQQQLSFKDRSPPRHFEAVQTSSLLHLNSSASSDSLLEDEFDHARETIALQQKMQMRQHPPVSQG